jgi:predicted transcriptional regulator
MKRDYIHIHHSSYYKAMKQFGCLDDLYPDMMGYKGGYSKNLTYEDCKKFREEHPTMTRKQLNSYWGYKSAMKRLGCFDELFPLYENPLKYTDEELISEAQKYETKVEMFRKCHKMYVRIKDRGLEDKAFAHMKVLGDRKKRMIYAYEFPDHSVYVGLTFNYDKRDKEHKAKENSAVRRHIKQTGLTPIHKPLTDYLPVKDAQRKEGEYVDYYRRLGWTILNVKQTGGVGTITNKVEDAKILEYHRMGMTNRRIGKLLGISDECVRRHLKKEGLINGRRSFTIRIEEMDEAGNVTRSFNNSKEAAEYYGVAQSSIKNAIYRRKRIKGHYLRYNPEDYEMKRGKKYKY